MVGHLGFIDLANFWDLHIKYKSQNIYLTLLLQSHQQPGTLFSMTFAVVTSSNPQVDQRYNGAGD